jgi:hypothetical protein
LLSTAVLLVVISLLLMFYYIGAHFPVRPTSVSQLTGTYLRSSDKALPSNNILSLLKLNSSVERSSSCEVHSLSDWSRSSAALWNRDGSVGIALGYGWTIGVLGFDSRRRLGIFLFTTASRTALGPTQPPIQLVPGALSLGVKRPGREADHSPPSSAEIKNAWSYTSTSRIGLHGVVLS